MDVVLNLLSPGAWVAACAIAVVAGFVKGVVGFAMPMVMVSSLGSFMAPELALAGLILPTVVTNFLQATRAGLQGAKVVTRKMRWFLAPGGVALICGAVLVPYVPERTYFLILGVPIVAFAVSQLIGWQLTATRQTIRFDVTVGTIAGTFGGISGVWGPPTVAYLTALNTPKAEQMQAQGVVYLAGAVLLVVAHASSGLLNWVTCAFSACLVLPALLGMAAGTAVQDRIDQYVFRRATLLVLLVAGANLVRRGMFL